MTLSATVAPVADALTTCIAHEVRTTTDPARIWDAVMTDPLVRDYFNGELDGEDTIDSEWSVYLAAVERTFFGPEEAAQVPPSQRGAYAMEYIVFRLGRILMRDDLRGVEAFVTGASRELLREAPARRLFLLLHQLQRPFDHERLHG